MRLSQLPLLGSLVLALLHVGVAQSEARVAVGPGGESVISVSTEAGVITLRETRSLVRELETIAYSGANDLAVVWEEVQDGLSTPWMALSMDGRSFPQVMPAERALRLTAATFDPREGQPYVLPALDVTGTNRLFIVQHRARILPSFPQALAAAGATVCFPLPHQALAVLMDPATAAVVKRLQGVRAVVPFQAAWKLYPTLLDEQLRGFSTLPSRRVNIMPVLRDEELKDEVIAAVEAVGGTLVDRNLQSVFFTADLSLQGIREMARHDLVQWIDLWSAPENDMDLARQFHGADYVLSTAGYDGTGVRGEVLDGGTLTTHVEWQVNPLIPHGGLVNGSHGTSTFGQVFATGVRADAKGMMPNGQGIAGFYNAYSGGSRPVHTAELVDPALNFRAVFQTNSWGAAQTTLYTTVSAEMDQIIYDTRLLILNSQSNTGNRTSRPQAWAKNVVSVGGIRHFGTLDRLDDRWNGGASIGPAEDGRTKPEIASFYDSITTTNNANNTSYTTSFGGTSGATPICAGTFGLFFQMWGDGIFNNPVTAGDVFDNRPEFTTAKAMIMNTAVQWPFSGTTDPNRDHQGFGNPDVQRLYDLRTSVFVVDANDPVAPLGTRTYSLSVPAGTPEFLATLIWPELPASPAAALTIRNNLDLRVIAPNGVTYFGNNGLRTAMVSASGGAPDTINTVEKIIIPNPVPGTWTVEVVGTNIVDDTSPATAGLDALFSLVVHGVVQGPPPPPPFGLQFQTVTGTGSLFLGIVSMPANATRGYTLFSFDTSRAVGAGNLFGIQADLFTLQGLGTAQFAGNPFNFPVGVPGVYPAVPLDLPAGALPFTGVSSDGVALVLDAAGNLVGRSRAVRVNW